MMPDRLTQYGFVMGAWEVERVMKTPTHEVIRITSGGTEIEIYLSRGGRKISVFPHKGNVVVRDD